MKTLIIFVAIFSFNVYADSLQALQYLQSQGLAKSHYDAYEFHYTNKPTPEEQTIKAYSDLSRDNAIMNQGYNQPTQNLRNCFVNAYGQTQCN